LLHGRDGADDEHRDRGMTEMNGGRMNGLCDILIKVTATRTNRIQEMNIAVGYMLCGLVEGALC
jgi:hypothetical protein